MNKNSSAPLESTKLSVEHGDPYYALENLSESISILATHPGTIRERLMHAYIQFAPVSGNDFPLHLRDEWNSIVNELTKKTARGNEGKVAATIGHMRIKRMISIAGKIIDLHSQLEEYLREINDITDKM